MYQTKPGQIFVLHLTTLWVSSCFGMILKCLQFACVKEKTILLLVKIMERRLNNRIGCLYLVNVTHETHNRKSRFDLNDVTEICVWYETQSLWFRHWFSRAKRLALNKEIIIFCQKGILSLSLNISHCGSFDRRNNEPTKEWSGKKDSLVLNHVLSEGNGCQRTWAQVLLFPLGPPLRTMYVPGTWELTRPRRELLQDSWAA